MLNEFGDCGAMPPRKPTLYLIDDAKDDEPGFIAARPILPYKRTYRDFEIYRDPPPIPTREFDWHFVHKDYDGAEDANDNRCGHGRSWKDCVEQINELYDDEGPKRIYTIGDGMGGDTIVGENEMLFAVAEELGDSYCDECDLPIAVCACEDAADYDAGYCFGCDLQLGDCICSETPPSDFRATLYRKPVVSGIRWFVVMPFAIAAWLLLGGCVWALTAIAD